jgi:hypothetical protein
MPLTHRKATEEETRHFFDVLNKSREDGVRRGLRGKEFIENEYAARKTMQLYYFPALNCVMWAPNPDQIFESWCDENNINPAMRAAVRIGWFGALDWKKQPVYDQATWEEIDAGEAVFSKLKREERTERMLQHHQKYGFKSLQQIREEVAKEKTNVTNS